MCLGTATKKAVAKGGFVIQTTNADGSLDYVMGCAEVLHLVEANEAMVALSVPPPGSGWYVYIGGLLPSISLPMKWIAAGAVGTWRKGAYFSEVGSKTVEFMPDECDVLELRAAQALVIPAQERK